jgi:hypothetical protein
MKPNQPRIRTVHGVEEPCSSPTASSPTARRDDFVPEESSRRKPSDEDVPDKSSPTPESSLFQTWQMERRAVAACLDELRDWMNEVSQLGIPHFGETATRLRPLRQRLIHHFAVEDEMIEKFAARRGTTRPGTDGPHLCSSREHEQLLQRLDDMLSRLAQPDPPFASWQAAMNEVEQFVDLLEEHESRESERIKAIR